MKSTNILLNLLLIFFSITTLDLKPAARSSKIETKETIERIDSDILIKAIENNEKEVAIKLIKSKQINLNFNKNKFEMSALHEACRSESNFIEIVKLLLEHGADVNIKNKLDGTPLMLAVWYDKFEISKLLLENGANVNAKNTDGLTALMYASYNDNIEIIKLLLEYDADVNAVNKNNQTALEIRIYGNVDVTYLIRDKHVINKYSETIFKAYEDKDIKTCKLYLNILSNNLCNKKNFLILKNKEKNSLLHEAVIKRDYTFIDYILNYNPEIVSDLLNMPNKSGKTPIDLAATDEYLLKYLMDFAYPETPKPVTKKTDEKFKFYRIL